MGRRYVSSLKYREFVRATLGFDGEGSLTCVPIQGRRGRDHVAHQSGLHPRRAAKQRRI
ncbi:MAG: hypothetical protein R2881_00590 [Eubacteriales bacterium]